MHYESEHVNKHLRAFCHLRVGKKKSFIFFFFSGRNLQQIQTIQCCSGGENGGESRAGLQIDLF